MGKRDDRVWSDRDKQEFADAVAESDLSRWRRLEVFLFIREGVGGLSEMALRLRSISVVVGILIPGLIVQDTVPSSDAGFGYLAAIMYLTPLWLLVSIVMLRSLRFGFPPGPVTSWIVLAPLLFGGWFALDAGLGWRWPVAILATATWFYIALNIFFVNLGVFDDPGFRTGMGIIQQEAAKHRTIWPWCL